LQTKIKIAKRNIEKKQKNRQKQSTLTRYFQITYVFLKILTFAFVKPGRFLSMSAASVIYGFGLKIFEVTTAWFS